jgi:gamma-glutamylputrescine oxidase
LPWSLNHDRTYHQLLRRQRQRYEPFPTLDESISCDVCVVGGGYTGLSSALHLAEMGYDVVLLEGARIGFGASGRNGGQLVNSYSRDIDVIEKNYGPMPPKCSAA